MDEKLSLLADLIKLANADGEFKNEEQQFIFAVAQQLGVKPKDYIRLFNENIKYNPPKLEFDRIVHFHRLVLLMNVDQNSGTAEMNLIKNLGLKMGLNPIAVNQVFTEMHNYPNRLMPPEKLIEIFKLYHN